MGNDLWAVIGAFAVLLLPLLMAWWLLKRSDERSRRLTRDNRRAKIDA
ncbi:MAG: hypothetical protein ACOZJX_22320 [Pseudomonadota bacterium]